MARGRQMAIGGWTLVALGGVMLALLTISAADPDRANAAPCGPPVITGTTDLRIEGDFSVGGCGLDDEVFSVFCGAGTVRFDYYVNQSLIGTTDTTVPCATPTRITVDGYLGGDQIDLTRVSAANGFTGITQPNRPLGSFGNDVLYGSPLADAFAGSSESDFIFARDGAADTVDCGNDFDFARVDAPGIDSLSSCEFIDFLPVQAGTQAVTAVPPTTGVPVSVPVKKCTRKKRRAAAAAKKRCRKKR